MTPYHRFGRPLSSPLPLVFAQIRRRVTEGSSLTEFRLDGVMPFPTQLFVEMLTCLEYRRVYDKYTTEIRRLPGVLPDSESEAVYWRLKLPLLAERDYLFVRRILYEPSTQVTPSHATPSQAVHSNIRWCNSRCMAGGTVAGGRGAGAQRQQRACADRQTDR